MFKKLIAVTAVVLLAGCKLKDDYDFAGTVAQAEAECQRFNGVRTVMYLDYATSNKPWTVTCVNTTTGNSFSVYVPGALK